MIMDQDFPGNVTIAVLSRSLKERFGGRHNNEQSCQKQRKNPRQKMERPENVLRSETTNRDTAFKITIRGRSYLMGSCSRWFSLFLYQGWYLQTEKETSFLTSCMASFDLTATSLFRKSGRQWGAPPVPVPFTKELFLLLLTEWYFLSSLGMFFFFFT